jgi:hypothetical protein
MNESPPIVSKFLQILRKLDHEDSDPGPKPEIFVGKNKFVIQIFAVGLTFTLLSVANLNSAGFVRTGIFILGCAYKKSLSINLRNYCVAYWESETYSAYR